MVDSFRPAWWCKGPHAQTLWHNRIRRAPKITLRRERVELPDGDFLDVDWCGDGTGPIVLLLHGLQGSSRSTYARAILRSIADQGWRGALMHFRGCSGEPNRLPRSYHSGETGDVAQFAALLQAREPNTPLAAIGVSLGGNVLLKWLGESGANSPLVCAVAVSVPFELAKAADRLTLGFSQLYQWSLLRCLRESMEQKRRQVALPLKVQDFAKLKTFWEFDEHVTAPLHGFRGARHYYEASSSRQYLRGIAVPTLLLQARDDPFLQPTAIPDQKELSASVTLECYEHGGHVGFVTGPWPWRARYWLDERIPAFIAEQLTARSVSKFERRAAFRRPPRSAR